MASTGDQMASTILLLLPVRKTARILFQRMFHGVLIGPVAQPGYFRVSSRVMVMGRPLDRSGTHEYMQGGLRQGKAKGVSHACKAIVEAEFGTFRLRYWSIELQCSENDLSQ